jgi:hypothetical protein
MATDMTLIKGKKKPKSLGTPPREPSRNLSAPEVAPANDEDDEHGLPDMRMMNRSQRTIAFATKVKPSTARRINKLAIQQRLRIVELLEAMVDVYEEHVK